MERKAYPTDASDVQGALVAPYLTLMTEDTSQRDFPLREVSGGLRWIVRSSSSWRLMPHNPPPWYIVYQHRRVTYERLHETVARLHFVAFVIMTLKEIAEVFA